MALDDILMGADDKQSMEAEIPVGTLNAPVDILTESDSLEGTPIAELTLTVEFASTFIF